MARDLLAALWPASYKGIPFYVEKDNEQGGRRLVVHEFPNRDDPFVEDLGEAARRYTLTLYLVGDQYDAAAAALVDGLTSSGVGMLVLPVQGPVPTRLHTFDRDRALDRTGYIGFRATFVRDTGGAALITLASLTQATYDAVAAASAASGASLSGLAIAGQTSFVIADAVTRLQDPIATLDAIRAGSALDPIVSATLAASFATAYQAVPGLLDPILGADPSIVPTLSALAVDLADAMVPPAAVQAFSQAFDDLIDEPSPDPTQSTTAQTIIANAQDAIDAARLAFLTAYVESLIRATYQSRQDGITARADCVERFDVALAASGGADQIDLLIALYALRDAAVTFFSSLINDLAPVVTVTMPRMLPVTVASYMLYGDTDHVADLLARNSIAHPSFMPLQFEALAPSAATLLPVA